jgi:hypothetical protein
VLGKSDDARQAIAKARLALPDNVEFQKHLDEVEKSVVNKSGATQ